MMSLRRRGLHFMFRWWDARKLAGEATGTRERFALMTLAHRPGGYVFRASVAFVLLMVAMLLLSSTAFDDIAKEFAPIHGLIPRLSRTSLLEISESLLQAQAALAALSFPIAIAFAALSHDREQRTTTLEIFFVESAVVLLALSSLAFIACSALVRFLIEAVEAVELRPFFRWGTAAMLLGWMFLNILITARFTHKTFLFLGRNGRRLFLVDYAVQAVRSQHMLAMVMNLTFRREISAMGLTGVRFSTGFDEGSYTPITRTLSAEARLVDVRMWLLCGVLRRWNKRHREGQSPLLLSDIRPDRLSRNIELAKLPAELRMTSLEGFLLRSSFKFRAVQHGGNFEQYEEYVASILTEARLALQRGDKVDYRFHLETFAELIRGALLDGLRSDHLSNEDFELLRALPPAADVWIFLRPARTIVYDVLLPTAVNGELSWLDEFIATIDEFVLPESGVSDSSTELSRDMLRFLAFVNMRLEDGWQTEHETQVAAGSIRSDALYLSGPKRRAFEAVVRQLVGRWEEIVTHRLPIEYRRRSKDDAVPVALSFFAQCLGTAQSVLAAVKVGDMEAAKWWMDSFIRWPSRFTYVFNTTVLGLDLLWAHSGEIGQEERVEALEPETLVRGSALRYQVLANFWLGARIILLSALVRESSQQRSTELVSPLIKACLSGDVLRPGSHYSTDATMGGAPTKLLADFLRLVLVDGFEGNFLDNFSREAFALRSTPMVLSRGYSGIGSQDRDSNLAQVSALLIASTASRWNEDSALLEAAYSWLLDDVHRKDRGLHVLREMINATRLISIQDLVRAFGAAVGPEWEKRRLYVLNGIESLVAKIQSQNELELIAAPVSQVRLRQLGAACERLAFSPSTGGAVLQLFREVSVAEQGEASGSELRTLRLEMSKTNVVDSPDATRAINESDWLAEVSKQYVEASVIASTYKRLVGESLEVTNSASYLEALLEQPSKRRMQGQVILLVSNQTEPDWLWNWRYPDDDVESDGAIVEKAGGEVPSAFMKINGVFAAEAPIKSYASLLVPRSAFERVIFERFSDGSLIETAWSAKNGNETQGVLEIRWKIRAFVAEGSAVELVHSSRKE